MQKTRTEYENSENKYYVYLHLIDGVVFYVGCSCLRFYVQGQARSIHARAYEVSNREKQWHNYAKGREFEVKIHGYYKTEKEALIVECMLMHEYRDNGALVNKKFTREVYQFDLSGTLIKRWISVKWAAVELNISQHSIYCCALKLHISRLSAGGFLWSYTNDAPDYYCNKTVVLQKSFSGEVLNVFESINHAVKYLGKNSQTSIIACIRGKYSHAYGFKWEKLQYNEWYKKASVA